MNSSSIPIAVARERVLPFISIAVAFTWLGDFLFWSHTPGASVAIFAVFAAAALLWAVPGEQRPTRASWIAAALVAASSCATLNELSLSNFLVLLALLAVLMGERHYQEIAAGWGRWSESFVAWICAAGRWPWLVRRVAEGEIAHVGLHSVTPDRASRFVQVFAPAACLALVFGVLFSFGNAIFRQWLTGLDTALIAWIAFFDFSLGRFLMWAALATFGLALARPRPAPGAPRRWTRPAPFIFRTDITVAIWQSCAVLVVLNVMFFAVNTIDMVYLWTGTRRALPENVSFSAFVHEGVYSLIFAVVLSAVVMAVLFQQEAKVSRNRTLKVLAWAWIAQNVVLIAGVFLRLKLYVDAYQMSELRVYVGCFLLLVTAGFGLLAWHIARGGNASTLIWRNVIATFVLFFLLQFPDVAGWVARSNVAQWQRKPSRTLDLAYLESLGPGAWPALSALAASPDNGESTILRAREIVRRLAAVEANESGRQTWQSYQARRNENGKRLQQIARRIESQ